MTHASIADQLYEIAPVWMQNQLVSIYGIYWHWMRFGGNYPENLERYQKRERFSEVDWKAYQSRQLHQLITTVAAQVPYYQKSWTKAQFDLALGGQLNAVPLLSKDAIRASPGDFIRRDQGRKKDWTFYTSGTTGTPIATRWLLDELRDSLAVREARSANWAGVSFTFPRATISGRLVEPDPETRGPYYRYNAAEKQVYFSAFHIKPDTARNYVEALERHKIEWMTGYAVSYYLLARFILEQNIQVPPIKAVITTSEKLTPEMRKVMQEAYHCRIFEEYSTVENALFASECEHGRLHVSPDVGIVEILRTDGTDCEPGEVGEVVTTCLMRTHQPLIRFRLGDLASWDPEPCPCGRMMPVLKDVVGRIEDVVVGPDGRQMVRFHGIFVHQPHIVEGQIIQEALDHIHVKVVPTSSFDEDDIRDITQRIQQRLGSMVRVTVEKVEFIPRSKSGKFKAVISYIR